MSIRLDLHIHSISHGREFITAQKLEAAIARSRLDGVAITNFHDISHALWLKRKLTNRVIMAGQEIITNDGHLLGLGLTSRVPDLLSAADTIELMRRQNALVVAPHPSFFYGIGRLVNSLSIDALESYNALMGPYFIFNYLARNLSRIKNIPQIASTDTTDERFVGHSFTEVLTDKADEILDKISNGNIRIFKRPLPVPAAFILKNLANFRNIDVCSLHATPCVVCDKSVTVRLFTKRLRCIDCGGGYVSRIFCSSGHYFCKKCIIKRIESANRNLQLQ